MGEQKKKVFIDGFSKMRLVNRDGKNSTVLQS
jgi:hypothetical protein